MRWSIIRLIWLRELRDQLRDRRTLFMVLILPLLLYPILGYAVLKFSMGFSESPSLVGIVGAPGRPRDFPPRTPQEAAQRIAAGLAWCSATPVAPAPGAAAFAAAGLWLPDYPPLIVDGAFASFSPATQQERDILLRAKLRLRIVWLDTLDKQALTARGVDLIVAAPAYFYARLRAAEVDGVAPHLELVMRPGDDQSLRARNRLVPLLESWKKELTRVRLARKNLPRTFDDPFHVHEPSFTKVGTRAEAIVDLLVRIFPFLLVVWSLAGALYPAIDLCAGEKERGTMETLLITPAGREEIVLGKFLAIWVFSSTSALLNLLGMGITTWQFGIAYAHAAMPIGALLWSVVLLLPLTALFSAVSLAVGAYARSSKEGQYYLMPLFLLTMPLVFLTLAPGVELNAFYSLVPVTGVALLMQRLMSATSMSQVPWLYFVPVLAPIALYSWLALKWAIAQFHREEVLFREAERIDVVLWLRSLFREKEATPTAGEACFCFAMIFALRWLAVGLEPSGQQAVHTAVTLLAFVAAPALFMTILFNTRPRATLLLYWPRLRDVGLAAVLSVLLLPLLAAATIAVLRYFPHVTRLLEERRPLLHELRMLHEGRELNENLRRYLFSFALLPALCEEIAFRGFILSGLRRTFRARTAIVLSSFMFALSYMNVFQFLPIFFLGVVLGLLTVRSRSLVPAMLFHFLHDSVLLCSIHAARALEGAVPPSFFHLWPAAIGICSVSAVAVLWSWYRRPFVARE